jgi:hypothetical protein
MSCAISITIDESVMRQCCVDAITQAVAQLAAKYDFDADEATSDCLNGLTIQRKRGRPAKDKSAKPAKDKSTKDKSTKDKSAKPAKDKSAKDKSKRGTTGYLLFNKEKRPETKAKLEKALGGDEKLKSSDVIKELATAWKLLSKDEQTAWKDKATIANSARGDSVVLAESVVLGNSVCLGDSAELSDSDDEDEPVMVKENSDSDSD